MKPRLARLSSGWRGGVVLWAGMVGVTGGLAQVDDRPEPPLDLNRNLPDMQSAAPRTLVTIYYPPMPPVLEVMINRGITLNSHPPPTAELRPYEGEVFYPMLGVRITRNRLKAPLLRQLEHYHAAREALIGELQEVLGRTERATPADRLRELEGLAVRQAPRFAELEARAEQLRSELIENDAIWVDKRGWHLSKPQKAGFDAREVSSVMRDAAFYLPHLLPEQRGLLREVAFEVSPQGLVKAEADRVYFSPALARIPQPVDLPVAVAQDFADYQTAKAQLKKELYDTVTAVDKSGWGAKGDRDQMLRALVQRQTPQLAALEAKAESIRRQLPPRHGPKAA